jgi:hypothetical protein
MNREPLNPIYVPATTGVWNDLPAFQKENFIDPMNIIYEIK